MEKEYYTVKEFAKLMDYGTDRIYEWLRSGQLKSLPKPTPHSIWRIPKSELNRLQGRVEQTEVGERISNDFQVISGDVIKHDKRVFNKACEILGDDDFQWFFELLSHNAFLASQLDKLLKYLEYFDNESNKYVDPYLNYVCLELFLNLNKVSELIQVDSIEHGYLESGYEIHIKAQVNNALFNLIKKLLDATSYIVVPETDILYVLAEWHTHHLVIDPKLSHMYEHLSDIFFEWQRKFDKLVNDTTSSYNKYRVSVREKLLI